MFSTTSLGHAVHPSPGEGAGIAADSREPTAGRPAGVESLSPPDARPAPGGAPARGLDIPIEPDHGFYLQHGKRALDLLIVVPACIVLLPFFALCAAAIKADTRGPIFYRSTRLGRGGRPFAFLKFRSMIAGAEQHLSSLAHLNEVTGPVFKMSRDPRITRVGRILRRTSVDELPQLLNVLRGEMTLVGPRPPIPDEVARYETWQLRRLSVTPGITCLWQISGRSRLGFDEWMRLDMEYITHRGPALDFKILLRTIPAVLSGEGAY